MKRILIGILAWTSMSAMAVTATEGKEYSVLKKPVAIKGDKVEVAEFFSYHCVHCRDLAPIWNAWKAQKTDIVIKEQQVVWNPSMLGLAKLHYTFLAVKAPEAIRLKAYDAMVLNHVNLSDNGNAVKFLVSNNVLKNDIAEKTLNSFASVNYANVAAAETRQYGIMGTPTIIVDGKYEIKPQKNWKDVLAVVDIVIEKAKQERKKMKK